VYETLYKEEPDELPSINFVRKCRVFVEVMGETLTAIKLANAPEWSQLWTNATTRRQIPFTALIIGVLAESGDIDPVVILPHASEWSRPLFFQFLIGPKKYFRK